MIKRLQPTPPELRPDLLLQGLLIELEQEGEDRQNRRQAPRYPVDGRLTLGVVVGGAYRPLHRVWLTDLSALGVGMLTENPLERGLQLHINLEPMTRQPCVIPLKVLYCRQLLPHTHRAGACFLWEDDDRPPTQRRD